MSITDFQKLVIVSIQGFPNSSKGWGSKFPPVGGWEILLRGYRMRRASGGVILMI